MTNSWQRQLRRPSDPEPANELLERPPSTAESLLALQRAGGNQMVTRYLQRVNGVTQPAKRKREDDPADLPDPKRRKIEVGLQVGEWTLDMVGAGADIWRCQRTFKWVCSYWRAKGDYHVKGKSGSAAGFETGYFDGEFKEETRKGSKNANAKAIAEGRAVFASAERELLPLYRNE